MYQKRHYEAIAASLGRALLSCRLEDDGEQRGIGRAAAFLMYMFKTDNPEFDEVGFMEAVKAVIMAEDAPYSI